MGCRGLGFKVDMEVHAFEGMERKWKLFFFGGYTGTIMLLRNLLRTMQRKTDVTIL